MTWSVDLVVFEVNDHAFQSFKFIQSGLRTATKLPEKRMQKKSRQMWIRQSKQKEKKKGLLMTWPIVQLMCNSPG